MSVGFFMGIAGSYTDEGADLAEDFIQAADRVLRSARLPGYEEPAEAPDVYSTSPSGFSQFGRSHLDHIGASSLATLAQHSRSWRLTAPHLALLADNPYRVAYVPVLFPTPLKTAHVEELLGDSYAIFIGSSPALRAELLLLASKLGIPLDGLLLADKTAEAINNGDPIYAGDTFDYGRDDDRTAWLLLFEGARLSVELNIALSLAG